MAFIPDDAFKQTFAFAPARAVSREEHHAYRVFAGARQVEFPMAALAREKLVGDLEQDACPVAGVSLAAAGAAML